ncbi:MAG: polysaccharide deacetylase family protein [Pseudomonadota bacterium]
MADANAPISGPTNAPTERLRPRFKDKARALAKRAVFEGGYRTGASKLLGQKYRGTGAVFMFHEITASRDDRLGLGCTVADFEATLSRIKRSGRDFVTLTEAKARLTNSDARPFVALTFDDGYRDNIELALPVMERFGAPATIFVPTQMATREIIAWWLAVRELVMLNGLIEVDAMARIFACDSRAEKVATYWQIIGWIWEDFRRASALADVFERYGVDMPSLVARHAMDVDEVRQADKHALIDIQAHTVSHTALATLSDADALAEMVDNKRWLENLLQRDVPHFAYPYGRPAIGGEREARLARQAGFDLALTTDPGSLFAAHGAADNLHLWPRENGEFQTSVGAGVAWALNGTWAAAKSRFGSPLVNINQVEPAE